MAAEARVTQRPLVASIIGTRPEAIKMAPLLRALDHRGFRQQVLLTGQHQVPADMLPDIPSTRLSTDLRNLEVDSLRARIRGVLCGPLSQISPDLVLVQGDTASALAGAQAADDCRFMLGHVEAGLRSFDLRQPYPEEGNRIEIDRLAALLFAPTATAVGNLRAEAVQGDIHLTGNTGIDALHDAVSRLGPAPPPGRRTILMTCHRRENQAEGFARIARLITRLRTEVDAELVFVLHPNRHLRHAQQAAFGALPITLLPPLGFDEMVARMRAAWLVLTDSGGLQEEGAALGRPVLVLRGRTERTEAPANIEIVGTDADHVCNRIKRLAGDEVAHARMSVPSLAFGDGHAAGRIASLIETRFTAGRRASR